MVSVIIPAFDEAGTVGASVAAAIRHPEVDEVLVVDDGSTDGTGEAAACAGARVVRLEHNCGKAEALDAGVRKARHDVMLFLDADVTGHTEETLTRIMQPVLDGRYEMYVGVHARSTVWLNRLLHFFPIIGGERALTRQLWESVPAVHKNGFQIEIAMNYSSKQFERGMGFELIGGTVHHTKEQKYGFWVGFWRRQCMVADIVSISFRLYILGTFQRLAAGLRNAHPPHHGALPAHATPPHHRLGGGGPRGDARRVPRDWSGSDRALDHDRVEPRVQVAATEGLAAAGRVAHGDRRRNPGHRTDRAVGVEFSGTASGESAQVRAARSGAPRVD